MTATEREIHALHYATGEPVRVRWRDGAFTEVKSTDRQPAESRWIAPALVDLQVNGYGGVDFQRDEVTLPRLEQAVRHLQAAGCTRFLPTLITDEWTRLRARLEHLVRLRSQSPLLQQAIAGWHIEGPFLSEEEGFRGAHPAEWLIDPSPESIHQLRTVTGRDPCLLTLAPERNGALETIELAVSLGIKVSMGHTNAAAQRLQQAVERGADGFTHLGNGCPRQLDRFDNILWRVLDQPGIRVGLIPDQIHVSGPLFRLFHRVLPSQCIYYTADAMAAAGAPPGRYTLGSLELEVGEDQVVRLPGKSNLAGSALRPLDGVFRAAQMLNCPWQESWHRFSEVPAHWMGLAHGLKENHRADFCLLQVSDTGRLEAFKVYQAGEIVG